MNKSQPPGPVKPYRNPLTSKTKHICEVDPLLAIELRNESSLEIHVDGTIDLFQRQRYAHQRQLNQ